MQVNSSSKLTILHDGQFWVALCEHAEGGLYGACRFVLGPTEPNDEQVLAFVIDGWAEVAFDMRPLGECVQKPAHTNPKRRQRLAHREVLDAGIGTKAQQAIKAQHEEGREARAQAGREKKREAQKRQFALKQQKRKAKHRGH